MIELLASVEATEEAKSLLLRASGFEAAPHSSWMVEVPVSCRVWDNVLDELT
jgi:hypothetical protein